MRQRDDRQAGDIMTSPVISLGSDTPVREAAQTLSEHGISGALVTDHRGLPVGVVSLFDIVSYIAGLERPPDDLGGFYQYSYPKFRGASEEQEEEFEMGMLQETPVEEIMTTEIIAVPEETPLDEVIRLMARRHIHRVFVAREGRPVGIISTMDVLKTLSRREAAVGPSPQGRNP